jgi:hypothetical protein
VFAVQCCCCVIGISCIRSVRVPLVKIPSDTCCTLLHAPTLPFCRVHCTAAAAAARVQSSRKMNLPRINLLLRELEEGSGGILLDAQGSSIWLYRCVFATYEGGGHMRDTQGGGIRGVKVAGGGGGGVVGRKGGDCLHGGRGRGVQGQ